MKLFLRGRWPSRRRHLRRGHRPTDQEALQPRTAVRAERLKLADGFDAFGDDFGFGLRHLQRDGLAGIGRA